jgi:hypothetical protein
MIKSYFGVGKISTNHRTESIIYKVISTKDLAVIIAHFDKYPLVTQKHADYLLFKSIVDLMNRKEHLTQDGLTKIVSRRASINNGLSPELKDPQ